MQLETLGDAFSHSVEVKMWCAFGPYTKGMKRGRECQWNATLDMTTLVATRGRRFPLAMLASRLKCPRCGSDRVRILWDVPSQPKFNAAAVVDPEIARRMASQSK